MIALTFGMDQDITIMKRKKNKAGVKEKMLLFCWLSTTHFDRYDAFCVEMHRTTRIQYHVCDQHCCCSFANAVSPIVF